MTNRSTVPVPAILLHMFLALDRAQNLRDEITIITRLSDTRE
jgi:hypothetical protein